MKRIIVGMTLLFSLGVGNVWANSCHNQGGCSLLNGQQWAYNRYSYAQQQAQEERAQGNYRREVAYQVEEQRPYQQYRYQEDSSAVRQRTSSYDESNYRRSSYQRSHYQHSTYERRAAAEPRHKAANFASQREATGHRVFIFDPQQTAWAAYESDGSLIRTGAASGGKGYCPDIHRHCRTPSGRFAVYHKGSVSCKSRKFPVGEGGAPMPYCMFFHGGYAIHGSYSVPNYNASHGCIRVHPSDAAWLSSEFVRNGTTVIVKPY